jgi:hypothetical protein
MLVNAVPLLLRDEEAVGSNPVTGPLVRRVGVPSPASDVADVACVWALGRLEYPQRPRPTSFRWTISRVSGHSRTHRWPSLPLQVMASGLGS